MLLKGMIEVRRDSQHHESNCSNAAKMDKVPPILIEDFKSAEARREFQLRINKLMPEKVSVLFFGFKSVEILLRPNCDIDVDEYDVVQLCKNLQISPKISLELDVLEEDYRIKYSTLGDAKLFPGQDITSAGLMSKIGLYLQQGDDVFLITTGHERQVDDKLYLPESLGSQGNLVGNPLAEVVYTAIPANSTPACDVALAKVHKEFANSVSNKVIMGDRTLQLAPTPGSCELSEDCLPVKMYSSEPKDYSKCGCITRYFGGCPPGYLELDDCLVIINAETAGGPLHGAGDSGMVVVKPDSPTVLEVAALAILIGELTVTIRATRTKPARPMEFSVAVPLDRTLEHLRTKANVPEIHILTANPGATGLAGSMGLEGSNDSEGSGGSAGLEGTERSNVSELGSSGSAGSDGSTELGGHLAETTAVMLDQLHPGCSTKSTVIRTSCASTKKLIYSRDWHVKPVVRDLIYCRDWRMKPVVKELIYSRYQLSLSSQADSKHSQEDCSVQQVQPLRVLLPPSTSIQCLPYELHEMMLMSSVRQLAKTLLKTDSRSDVEPFVTLASVCKYFHTILTKRKWFARTLQQYLTVVSRPYRLCPRLLMTVAGQRRAVFGLDKLDNKLYVVYCESDTIDVYTTTTQPSYTQLHSIHVNGLKTPVNIAACSINSCLYVADYGVGVGVGACVSVGCVWKVTRDHKVGKWLDEQNVFSLSVTSDGRVVLLIAIDVERDSDEVGFYRGRVDVYSAAGVKLSVVKLPRDILNPRHVLQTVNKSFIVCHGTSRTEPNRVCEVSNAGVHLKSYGGSSGSELGQLNSPCCSVLDKDKRVFVADCLNQRVLLLDKQLNIQRVLLTWSRDCPLKLFYDRETTQLIVGLTSGKLEVYSLL